MNPNQRYRTGYAPGNPHGADTEYMQPVGTEAAAAATPAKTDVMTLAQQLADAIHSGAGYQTDALDKAMSHYGTQSSNILDRFNQSSKSGARVRNKGFNEAMDLLRGGSTVGGLDDRFNQMRGTDAFNALREQRMQGATDMLSAGGLTRSGSAMRAGADIDASTLMELESLLRGREEGMGSLTMQKYDAAGGAIEDRGRVALDHMMKQLGLSTQSMIKQGDIQAGAEVDSSSALVEAALAELEAKSQKSAARTDATGAILGGLFKMSDPRLKENIQPIHHLGPLTVYRWDWKDEAHHLDDYKTTNVGFMSDEVKQLYPEFVSEIGGYDAIDYVGLLEVL